MQNTKEIWKDIPGYEGHFQVSTYGNVRSLTRDLQKLNRWGQLITYRKKGIQIKQHLNNRGYYAVYLWAKTNLVHRTVGIVFLEKKDGKTQINHKNMIKTDNRVENLEWCTSRENTHHHCVTIGKVPVTEKQATDIILSSRSGEKLRNIAIRLGRSRQLVNQIASGILWKDLHQKLKAL